MKEEIRLDGKLSKKLGLRDGNVGRANWEDERNNHIRHFGWPLENSIVLIR